MKEKSFVKKSLASLLAASLLFAGLNARPAFAADGILDSAFGINGVVVNPFNLLPSSAKDVALQPDGKIVVLGASQSAQILARYQSGGRRTPPLASTG